MDKRQNVVSIYLDVFPLVSFSVASGIENCNSENLLSIFVRDVRKMIQDIICRMQCTKNDTGWL